jgi:hypothetical protein
LDLAIAVVLTSLTVGVVAWFVSKRERLYRLRHPSWPLIRVRAGSSLLPIVVVIGSFLAFCGLCSTVGGSFRLGFIRFGDAGVIQYVEYRNNTDIPVVLYGGSDFLTPTPTAQLQPGETLRKGWFVGPGITRQREVKAFDLDGNLMFCRNYTNSYDNAKQVVQVEIVKGQVECQ